MVESHAYGWSFGCISRRLFVLTASSVMFALCFIQLVRWILSWRLWDAIMGNSWKVESPADCIGTQCYEVMSCFGMKEASLHVREPLVTLAGLVILPTAISGAHHCSHRDLRFVSIFFIATAALHAAVVAADAVYFNVCGQYPANMIHHTLLSWMPPSPLSAAAKAKLQSMSTYSVQDVAAATNDFQVLNWYYAVAGLLAVFLIYLAREVMLLGDLAERGPLGLGMHFGLNQWDEILDHDAFARYKLKGTRSAFLNDAQLSKPGSDLESAGFGYAAAGGGDYGTVAFLPKTDDEDDAEGLERQGPWLLDSRHFEAAADMGPMQPQSAEDLDTEEEEEAAAAASAAAAAEEAQAAADAAADRRALVF
mmetsp:Transcript_129591/g.375336  ORF Transcript_129591/g.375336 Transcript_129591/m.375336 type:complete len:366 (-) Transcript_129591:2-1099(-)